MCLSSSSCFLSCFPKPKKNPPKKEPPLSLSPSYAVRQTSKRISSTRASLRNRRFSSSPPNTTSDSVPGTTQAVWPRRLRGTDDVFFSPAESLVRNETNVAVSTPVVTSVPKSIRETSRRVSVSSSLEFAFSSLAFASPKLSTAPPTRNAFPRQVTSLAPAHGLRFFVATARHAPVFRSSTWNNSAPLKRRPRASEPPTTNISSPSTHDACRYRGAGFETDPKGPDAFV